MKSFEYLGFVFEPYGNIVGKDDETRFQRLMYSLNTLIPLLTKDDGYEHEKFYATAGENSTDIYFVPQTAKYYIPIFSGICHIDIAGMKKYIKKVNTTK